MARRVASVVCGLLLLLAVPAAAAADRGGDDETRVRTGCVGGNAELRVRARDDDDTLEIEVRLDTRRAFTWRIVVLHERSLVYKGTTRATRSFRLRRTIADWPGRETVTVRAVTGAGRTCRVVATI